MKHLVQAALALSALGIFHTNDAEACTRHSGVTSFTVANPHLSQNIVIGNVTFNGGSAVAMCDLTSGSPVGTLLANQLHASLPTNSRVCLGAGNDTLRVLRAGETFQCGAGTLVPLNYGGRQLIIVGQDGADRITGGDGSDMIDFYSGATLPGFLDIAGSGRGNDELWFSGVGTGRHFGGSGNDLYYSWGTGHSSAQDLSGTDRYVANGSGVDRWCDQDFLHAGAFCGGQVGDQVNFLGAAASCPFNLVCASIGSPPRPDI